MFHDELLPAVSSFDSRRFTRFSPQLLRKRRRCRSGRAASLGFHPGCGRRCCRCRRYGNRHRHGDCCSDPGKAKPGTELRPGKRHRQNTSWWVWDFSPSLFLVIWPRQSLTWGQRSPPEASVSCDFGVAANQLVTQIHDTCFFSAADGAWLNTFTSVSGWCWVSKDVFRCLSEAAVGGCNHMNVLTIYSYMEIICF